MGRLPAHLEHGGEDARRHVDAELHNLAGGEVLLPPDLEAQGRRLQPRASPSGYLKQMTRRASTRRAAAAPPLFTEGQECRLAHRVVEVHRHVHAKIEHDRNPLHRGLCHELSVAEHERPEKVRRASARAPQAQNHRKRETKLWLAQSGGAAAER